MEQKSLVSAKWQLVVLVDFIEDVENCENPLNDLSEALEVQDALYFTETQKSQEVLWLETEFCIIFVKISTRMAYVERGTG